MKGRSSTGGGVIRDIALLTDSDVEDVLQALLKLLVDRKPEYGQLLANSQDMKRLVQAAGLPAATAAKKKDAAALRKLLVFLAEDSGTAKDVKNIIKGLRPTYLEPVTTALVLGGIVFVLSIKAKLKIEHKEGRTQWFFEASKDKTSDSILKKFFDIF